MSGWLNDDSGQGHVATAEAINGGTAPTYDVSNKKWGSSSAKFVRTSNSVGGQISLPNSSDWYMNMTWTMQCWVKVNGYSGWESGLISRDKEDNSGQRAWIGFELTGSGKFNSSFRNLDDQWCGSAQHSTSETDGNWHHLMICRNNPTWHYFIDGRLKYYHAGTSGGFEKTLYSGSSLGLTLGVKRTRDNFDHRFFNGWIDGIHIEKDIARETGTNVESIYFDPDVDYGEPSATGYSVLVMNFNEIFYQVQGTVSDEARITVTDEDSRTIEHDAVEPAGAYAIDVDDNSLKTVTAVRESDGKLLGYGRVIPTSA